MKLSEHLAMVLGRPGPSRYEQAMQEMQMRRLSQAEDERLMIQRDLYHAAREARRTGKPQVVPFTLFGCTITVSEPDVSE